MQINSIQNKINRFSEKKTMNVLLVLISGAHDGGPGMNSSRNK